MKIFRFVQVVSVAAILAMVSAGTARATGAQTAGAECMNAAATATGLPRSIVLAVARVDMDMESDRKAYRSACERLVDAAIDIRSRMNGTNTHDVAMAIREHYDDEPTRVAQIAALLKWLSVAH